MLLEDDALNDFNDAINGKPQEERFETNVFVEKVALSFWVVHDNIVDGFLPIGLAALLGHKVDALEVGEADRQIELEELLIERLRLHQIPAFILISLNRSKNYCESIEDPIVDRGHELPLLNEVGLHVHNHVDVGVIKLTFFIFFFKNDQRSAVALATHLVGDDKLVKVVFSVYIVNLFL